MIDRLRMWFFDYVVFLGQKTRPNGHVDKWYVALCRKHGYFVDYGDSENRLMCPTCYKERMKWYNDYN